MNLKIRPIHFTYVINDRRAHSFFFRTVLDMKVLRHVEVSKPADTACPEKFSNRWCKTVFGYGPEASHFGIALVYFYREVSFGSSNEWIGATIKSLPAIARAKAMGIPMVEVDDKSYKITSPSGRIYSLIDEQHRFCDPLAEIYLRVNDLNASLQFWNEILEVIVISKTNKEFTLFFGNRCIRLRYMQTDGDVDQNGHMAYTAPFKSIQMIQQRCPAENLLQPLCQISYDGRDSDYLMILKDPNGFVHYFHDSESFEEVCRYDSKAEIRWDLSVHYENKFQQPYSYLQKIIEDIKKPENSEYIHTS